MSSLIVEEWRDIWAFKHEFMIVGLSYLFATTNFLNLPRLVLENGGLAFLVAYGAALLLISLPIIVLELSVGQLTGRGPVQAFYNICPVFKGVGIAQVLLSMVTLACMTRYLAWLFLYVFHLFWSVLDERPGLPWLNCHNFPELQTVPCRESAAVANTTQLDLNSYVRLSTLVPDSALSHFMRALEQPSTSIAEIGHFQIYLLIAQAIVWAMVFAGICFGVRWLGKVTVFTFISPLFLMIILLARTLFLRGALAMFQRVYDETNWERLADHMVWKAAAEQALLASGVGFGVYITIGSYNKRSNNLVQDSILLLIGHAALTALQLATVFGLVGHVSLETGLAPREVLGNGEHQMWNLLVYLHYVPSAKLFTGILLFACIFMLLNIFYLLSLNILATLEDALGEKWSRCFPRFALSIFISLVVFGTTLYFTTQAGKYAYELVSGYLKYITLWIILAFELLAVTWFYCAHTLGKDLKSMLKSKCCWCLGHSILYLTYLLIAIPIAIAVFNLLAYDFQLYSEQVRNWPWSEYLGFAIGTLPLLPIPFLAFFTICYNCRDSAEDATKGQKLRYSFRSPLRYELMKNSTSAITAHTGTQNRSTTNNNHHHHDGSPRYNNSVPAYSLLPQSDVAPLAEQETYNETVYGGIASNNNATNLRDIPTRHL